MCLPSWSPGAQAAHCHGSLFLTWPRVGLGSTPGCRPHSLVLQVGKQTRRGRRILPIPTPPTDEFIPLISLFKKMFPFPIRKPCFKMLHFSPRPTPAPHTQRLSLKPGRTPPMSLGHRAGTQRCTGWRLGSEIAESRPGRWGSLKGRHPRSALRGGCSEEAGGPGSCRVESPWLGGRGEGKGCPRSLAVRGVGFAV